MVSLRENKKLMQKSIAEWERLWHCVADVGKTSNEVIASGLVLQYCTPDPVCLFGRYSGYAVSL